MFKEASHFYVRPPIHQESLLRGLQTSDIELKRLVPKVVKTTSMIDRRQIVYDPSLHCEWPMREQGQETSTSQIITDFPVSYLYDPSLHCEWPMKSQPEPTKPVSYLYDPSLHCEWPMKTHQPVPIKEEDLTSTSPLSRSAFVEQCLEQRLRDLTKTTKTNLVFHHIKLLDEQRNHECGQYPAVLNSVCDSKSCEIWSPDKLPVADRIKAMAKDVDMVGVETVCPSISITQAISDSDGVHYPEATDSNISITDIENSQLESEVYWDSVGDRLKVRNKPRMSTSLERQPSINMIDSNISISDCDDSNLDSEVYYDSMGDRLKVRNKRPISTSLERSQISDRSLDVENISAESTSYKI